MQVKLEENNDGEIFLRIPSIYEQELQWNEGDLIEWIDNKNGSWTLQKISSLDKNSTTET
ncbi:hypothetical protein [Shewanella frigidimarina]|uniref:AbrB/MazE/SpoVT family DNA-binding domain-containing protein n=1 Tax=Shewanella frigidimarina TaxID=56812 RepID=A0A106C2I1_SHEFR|nr:hypothetical protein [Shewanella frigidimarina]KVX03057.1 hypothetical protein AWJ07_00305 [Shewanella frigidimarina]